MHVAGGDHAPCGGDADLWFLEIIVFKSNGSKHGTRGSAVDAVNNLG